MFCYLARNWELLWRKLDQSIIIRTSHHTDGCFVMWSQDCSVTLNVSVLTKGRSIPVNAVILPCSPASLLYAYNYLLLSASVDRLWPDVVLPTDALHTEAKYFSITLQMSLLNNGSTLANLSIVIVPSSLCLLSAIPVDVRLNSLNNGIFNASFALNRFIGSNAVYAAWGIARACM